MLLNVFLNPIFYLILNKDAFFFLENYFQYWLIWILLPFISVIIPVLEIKNLFNLHKHRGALAQIIEKKYKNYEKLPAEDKKVVNEFLKY